jgi:hypothetical protein
MEDVQRIQNVDEQMDEVILQHQVLTYVRIRVMLEVLQQMNQHILGIVQIDQRVFLVVHQDKLLDVEVQMDENMRVHLQVDYVEIEQQLLK